MDKFVVGILTSFLIILIVSLDVESRGSRFGGRFSSPRFSSVRYTRTRISSKTRYIGGTRYSSGTRYIGGTRYSRSSSSIAWKTGIIAGTYYGSRYYMRRRRWYNNKAPTYCTNYYDTDSSGRGYGHFICPMEGQADNMVDCCGKNGREKCCDGKLSGGVIAGIVVGVFVPVAVIVGVCIFCCCIKNRGTQKGTVFNAKKGTHPVGPVPPPVVEYTPQEQTATVPTISGHDGMQNRNLNYGMEHEFKAGGPPENVPNGINTVQPPPSYNASVGGPLPYPPQPAEAPYPLPGELPYHPPREQPYVPVGGAYPPPEATPYTTTSGQPYPPLPPLPQ